MDYVTISEIIVTIPLMLIIEVQLIIEITQRLES